jgi:hypothetical protein
MAGERGARLEQQAHGRELKRLTDEIDTEE